MTEPAERLLILDFASKRFALQESAISAIAEPGPVRPVPRAPDAVIGLTDWRGHVMTLVDLNLILGDLPRQCHACIVRLAPPFDRTALRVQATLRLVERRGEIDAGTVDLLDPPSLLRGLIVGSRGED